MARSGKPPKEWLKRPIQLQFVERAYAETPAYGPNELICQACGSMAIIYPARSIDPRWATGYCIGCRKTRICDVVHTRQA